MQNNFETFNDVLDLKLRVYNRTAMLFNLTEDFGQSVGQDYLELFTENERAQMLVMSTYIKNNGLEAVRSEVTKNLVVVGSDEPEE